MVASIKTVAPTYMFFGKTAQFVQHLWATSSRKTVYIVFYSLEENNTGRTRQKRRVAFFTIQPILLKWYNSQMHITERTFKKYSLENERSLSMGEGIPLQKNRDRWRRALMVCINV